MLRSWPATYYSDDINPASFVSHANVENEEDLELKDLIRQMKDRLTMFPELAPLFMKHEEALGEILNKFTRLADGEGYLSHSGLHGLRGVDEPLMDRVYKVLSSLG